MQILLLVCISLKEMDVSLDNSASFKYIASLLGKVTDADGNDRSLKNAKISDH